MPPRSKKKKREVYESFVFSTKKPGYMCKQRGCHNTRDKCKRCKEWHTDFCADHAPVRGFVSQRTDCKVAMCILCKKLSCRKHMRMLTLPMYDVTIQLCWRCGDNDARSAYKLRKAEAKMHKDEEKTINGALHLLEAELLGRAVTSEEMEQFEPSSDDDTSDSC